MNRDKTVVRMYRDEDFEPCVSLFISVYNAPPWNDRWTEAAANNHLRELRNHQSFAGFTLLDEAHVLGAAFCYEKTWWDGRELYIDEFYVSAHHRRRGYGTELMDAIKRYADENALTSITLLTDRDKPAFEFYKKNGLSANEQTVFMYK